MRPEELRPALGFDDLGLLPADSTGIPSRRELETHTKLSRHLNLKYPLMSAPMDTISGVETCVALNSIGAAGILHRFMPIESQVRDALAIKSNSGKCYAAIGLQDYQERVPRLITESHVDLVYLDTANGSSPLVERFMRWFLKEFPEEDGRPDIIIGNTLTKASVSKAINLGADGVRHGIGIGSACTTSDMTGIQCPPVTALYYGWKALRNWELERNDLYDSTVTDGDRTTESIVKDDRWSRPTLLLDGGIRKSADLVKAIVCGADAVICGNIFARHKEVPLKGKISYRGMASQVVMEDYNLWDGKKENLFVEGKEIRVPDNCDVSVVDVVYRFANGLRSAMSYLGFTTIEEMRGSLWEGECIGVRL